MKVHNNKNYLKSLGPTAAEMQAAMKAEPKRKEIKLDSEATEKIRIFQNQISGAQKKLQNGSGSHPQLDNGEKNLEKEPGGENPENSVTEELPPGTPSAHIDIKA